MNENLLKDIYKARINKTMDLIERDMDHQFTLAELAAEANFSKFHFHRIFQGITGETPFQFLTRIRLEKAATMISTNPNDSITEIAFKCGFTDISVFSRNFKKHFKVSASQWRNESYDRSNSGHLNSNLSQQESKNQQSETGSSMYFSPRTNTLKWRTNMKLNQSIEVKEFQPFTVAYLRYTGPYKGNENLFESLWNKLFKWAGPRDLIGKDVKSLIIYHDDPNVTEEDKLRLSVCISVAPDTKVDGEFGKMDIEGGKYAVARFTVTAEEFEQAWEWVYGEWLPSSGYQPDDKPCFEMCQEEPRNGKYVADICIPVKPL